MHNWARNNRWRPAELVYPTSEQAIQALVTRAAEGGRTIRPLGSAHSWSPVCVGEDIVVSLRKMRRVLDLTEDAVTVEGGATLAEISAALRKRGLSLSNLGSITRQTVAGAISTATHGTGLGQGTLCDQVAALRVTTANSQVEACSAAQNPDLLHAALSGMGALGIISAVTFAVEPRFRLHTVERKSSLPDVLVSLERDLRQNEFYKFFWFPHTDQAITISQNRTERRLASRSGARWLEQTVSRNLGLYLVLSACSLRPSVVPNVNCWLARLSRPLEYVDYADRSLTVPTLFPHTDCEFAVPLAKATAAIEALQGFLLGNSVQASPIIQARFVGADRPFLSPAFGEPVCFIGAIQARVLSNDKLYEGFEKILSRYNGRPHWGKMHRMTEGALSHLYPAWDRFGATRRRFDPDGTFLTPYLGRLLGA